MERVAIVASVRTPIGKFLGSFAELSAADLGVAATRGLLERAGAAPGDVDELIYGCARQAGGGPNMARQVLIRAGIPQERPAFTVNQACGSGLQAILLAAERIRSNRARVVVAGGAESMTRVPYLLDRARTGYRLGNAPLADGMYRDGFLDPICGLLMGETAEKLADLHKISREEQDAYALESQRRAGAAIREGRFKDEIVPVTVPGRKGESRAVTGDEHPRPDTTLEEIKKLPPVFREGGTVHAGNSSGITDGASSILLVAESVARERGMKAQAWVGESTVVGVDPSIMGIGPVPATRELLGKTGRTLDAYELIELNEAFAAQVLACERDLKLDRARLNVNGGAIALGHPIGATGARIVTTLVHEMERRGASLGLATLCVSGGLGIALELIRN
ncbi:MAG: acetyl-CoA C-acetyltransferase [Candidatus Eisenbacteria bacterium]|uniref:Acetyl-CoA C-acetyltransferase n=1 Tax=Eiseniibacteriota bacterium TaxID=2212470 RepID=A0A538TQX1_UNCEI|nr:MAG: acetyl-CoA C-acetyltransferase [Candidatus Eisenbacteria bacterium]